MIDSSVEEPEVVDGVLVVADVRAVEVARQGPPPFVQVAAVAATGFVAGAATAAVLGRHFRARAGAPRPECRRDGWAGRSAAPT